MNRRQLLARVAAAGAATALPIQQLAQRVQPAAQKAADAARLLGFRISYAPADGPAVMNIWRRLNEEDEVLAGWIYGDGSVIWEGAIYEGLYE